MIQLYKNGAWLINGTELVEDSPEAKAQIQQKYDKVVPVRKRRERIPLPILFYRRTIHQTIWKT